MMDNTKVTKVPDKKLQELKNILTGYGKISVALSGGVDSVFLLTFSCRVLGNENVSAITATGPHFADDETDYAARLCDALHIRHKAVSMDGILDVIGDNPPDRCYICKREIFSSLKELASSENSILADGTNLDDMDDYRPGYRAITELGISSPLKDAGLTKDEIRLSLESLAEEDSAIRQTLTIPSGDGKTMAIWEKPAFACLASRIPYGERLTEKKLTSVYKAENLLKELGFRQIRVRHHGDVARIEVLPEDREKFFDTTFMDEVNEGIKACGFKFAVLDLAGYRMGNLNQQTVKRR